MSEYGICRMPDGSADVDTVRQAIYDIDTRLTALEAANAGLVEGEGMSKLYVVSRTVFTDCDAASTELREATQAEIDASASAVFREDAAVGKAVTLFFQRNPEGRISKIPMVSATDHEKIEWTKFIVDTVSRGYYWVSDTLADALRAAGLVGDNVVPD